MYEFQKKTNDRLQLIIKKQRSLSHKLIKLIRALLQARAITETNQESNELIRFKYIYIYILHVMHDNIQLVSI